MSSKQTTLNAPLSFCGKGLHTGLQVAMTVQPAEAGYGIKFKRTDLEGQPEVEALADYVVDTSRGTTIEKRGVRISTIEHIMAALWGCGVDNACIEIDAPETPIMDGSAREYVAAIQAAGLKELEAIRNYYTVTEKTVYSVPERGVELIIYPDDTFSANVNVDYNSHIL
ncbi:MAG: UDP-3-O-acyl-N-acetylglucosamine deacetylase, partial [Alistipes sp.]|nr:UDP-3-O-acyl-N-acetylglucosamine deacetylase [Alistipes sp.]